MLLASPFSTGAARMDAMEAAAAVAAVLAAVVVVTVLVEAAALSVDLSDTAPPAPLPLALIVGVTVAEGFVDTNFCL